MQIQVNTDHHIEGRESLTAWTTAEVTSGLSHHAGMITRVEVHLSEENGQKAGPGDKRCVMEARLQGRQPMAVTHHGDTLYQAVTGAADKLDRMIANALGRSARDVKATPELMPAED